MEHDLQHVDARRFLDCVHCGLCLSACPTYVELGTEMDSPRGRIYLMKGLRESGAAANSAVVRHLDGCLGCRACETACPSGVQYGQLLEAARAQLAATRSRPRLQAWRSKLVNAIFPFPERLRTFLMPVRLAQRLGLWSLVSRLVPAAALLPEIGKAVAVPAQLEAQGRERAKVGLLLGCVNRVLFGQTNTATARVLSRNGCRVVAPAEQGCCGALHLHAGDIGAAASMARALIDAFPPDLDLVIVNAAGCGAAMKSYGELLADDPLYAERAATFAGKVRDVTEFLASAPLVKPLGTVRARVTYHDACHLAHAQGVRAAPRELIRAIPGTELVELEEADHCCGSAGSYNLTEPAMARRLGDRKTVHIRDSGARIVLAANPGCALQIAAGLRRAGVDAEVMHPVELLDRAYGGGE